MHGLAGHRGAFRPAVTIEVTRHLRKGDAMWMKEEDDDWDEDDDFDDDDDDADEDEDDDDDEEWNADE